MPWPVVILKYFFKKRNEGQPFKKAVFATAHKLIRVIFAMFSNRTYSQENRGRFPNLSGLIFSATSPVRYSEIPVCLLHGLEG